MSNTSPAVSSESGGSSSQGVLLSSSIAQSLGETSRAFFVPGTPRFPAARASLESLPNPLFGQSVPLPPTNRPLFCQCDRRGGERCAFCWAWEPSESHSIPTVWSGATSLATSMASFGSGLFPSGQRLLWLQPERVCMNGSFIVAIKREIPQELWQGLEVKLKSKVNDMQFVLKPDGVRKGKKIALTLTDKISDGDYDVTVGFASIAIPGVLTLEVVEQRPDTGCSA